MRRALSSLLLLALAAMPARGHFIWLLPEEGRKPKTSRTDEDKDKPREDPSASKLLAEARAARANWENFPGFSADLEVNVNGKLSKGRVDVDAKGKVTLSGWRIDESDLAQNTRRHLASIVSHRMDGSASLKTPCAFADDNAGHPLGRAVRVLNDEAHSSYRIRDRQIIVVNRTLPGAGSRFTIVVTQNKLNEEKQFLPSDYVVNSWDLKGALKSSQTFHHQWTRLGKFDLPQSVLVVTATSDGKLESRRLTLSNHKLK